MYRKIMLGLLMFLLAIIGFELTHPRTVPAPIPESPSLNASLMLLDRRIPELILHNATIEQAVGALRGKTDVPIEVDWEALKQWKNLPVDVEFRDITLGDAVAFLFSFRRGESLSECYADFDVVNGKVVVASNFGLPHSSLTQRTYDVRDIFRDDCSSSPSISIGNLLERLSGIENWEPFEYFAHPWPNRKMGLGAHDEWAGRLFITQTAYNQRRVESVFECLRTGKSSLVARAPMRNRIDLLDFHSTPLRKAIHEIAEKTHVSIAIESKKNSEIKLDLDKPISATLKNVSLGTALDALVQLAPEASVNEFESGVVVVSNAVSNSVFSPRDNGIMEIIDASALVKESGEPLTTECVSVFGGSSDAGGPGKSLRDLIRHYAADPEFFGTRIIVRGNPTERKRVRKVVECLSQPVSLSSAQMPPFAGEPSRRLARFHLDNVSPVVAFAKWRTLAGPNVIMRQEPDSGQDEHVPLSIDLKDVTLEDAVKPILRDVNENYSSMSIEDGLIYLLPQGETPGGIVRAYDVSPIMKSPEWYIGREFDDDPKVFEEIRGKWLAELVSQELAQTDCAFWHGRLVVTTTPGGHRRVRDYLRQMQAIGKIPPRPEE